MRAFAPPSCGASQEATGRCSSARHDAIFGLQAGDPRSPRRAGARYCRQRRLTADQRTGMYQTDPDARPDSEFAPGELRWLVTGNTGRLLDGRRTPVRVTALDLAHGYFEAEILAFEDAGARWLVPLEDVTRYQFAPA